MPLEILVAASANGGVFGMFGGMFDGEFLVECASSRDGTNISGDSNGSK